MIPQRTFVFADDVSAAYISNECINSVSDILDLQVSGTFTGLSLIVEGKTNLNADYVSIKVIDIGAFKSMNEIVAAGIYELGIAGLQAIRVKVQSVTGGTVTVVGRMIKEG